MPLYPILTYLTGGSTFQYLFDIILSTLTIAIIYKTSQYLFNQEELALFAAFCCAIYPRFIFFSISGLTESSNIFLICLSFYAFYIKRYALACFSSILAIYIRPTTDLIAPILILAFILIVHRQNWKIAIKWCCLYGLMYGILFSPWWIYNYHQWGHFIRLDVDAGQVLYAGNNPMNKTGDGILGVDVDETTFTEADPVKREKAFKTAAINYIKAHPWHIIKLDLYNKMIRFWRAWSRVKEYNSLLTIFAPILSYGVMLFCFIIYLYKHFSREWRKMMPIMLFIIYLTAVHLVTIASGRYRLPLEPFIILLGSYPLYNGLKRISHYFVIYATPDK